MVPSPLRRGIDVAWHRGIVLTIGMAVDANVLIYERIREEMRGGKGLMVALKEGYAKAYSAIIAQISPRC